MNYYKITYKAFNVDWNANQIRDVVIKAEDDENAVVELKNEIDKNSIVFHWELKKIEAVERIDREKYLDLTKHLNRNKSKIDLTDLAKSFNNLLFNK